mmetsp:Transcript_30963/g.67665  ORF Transcript_30963/g.67665 Transcript_30963/m.67665 type:complete len:90 (-) Transcript_30963:98-367(-)
MEYARQQDSANNEANTPRSGMSSGSGSVRPISSVEKRGMSNSRGATKEAVEVWCRIKAKDSKAQEALVGHDDGTYKPEEEEACGEDKAG